MDIMSYLEVKCLVRRLLVAVFLVFASPLWAEGKESNGNTIPVEDEGTVKLVATLQDGPAFTEVIWKVYRLDAPNQPVVIITRHSAIVNLQPGNYRAVALLKSKRRSQSFNLESRGVEEIILSMDQ